MAQYGFDLPLTQQGTRSREKPETCLGKSSVLCGPGNPLAISLAYDETTGMLPTNFTGIMLLERHSFVYKGHDKQGLEVSDT